MTDNVNEVDLNSDDVLALIEGDEELSKLPLGSEDLKAALIEKMSKTEEDSANADADETEDADDDGKSEDSEEQDDKPKKPRGLLRRVEKLVTRNHDLERQLAEMQAKLQEATQQVVEEAVGDFQFDVPKPKLADFDTLEDYQDARDEWRDAYKAAKADYEASKTELNTKVKEVMQSWETREAEAKRIHKDYTAVVNVKAVTEANPSQAAKEFLADSDIGPMVIYEALADDDFAEEFAKATSAKQVRMLAKIESRLLEETAEETPRKTSTEKKTLKTPSPLPKGRPTAAYLDPIKDADKMSDEEWDRAYEAEMAKKRRR